MVDWNEDDVKKDEENWLDACLDELDDSLEDDDGYIYITNSQQKENYSIYVPVTESYDDDDDDREEDLNQDTIMMVMEYDKPISKNFSNQTQSYHHHHRNTKTTMTTTDYHFDTQVEMMIDEYENGNYNYSPSPRQTSSSSSSYQQKEQQTSSPPPSPQIPLQNGIVDNDRMMMVKQESHYFKTEELNRMITNPSEDHLNYHHWKDKSRDESLSPLPPLSSQDSLPEINVGGGGGIKNIWFMDQLQ
ncbi:hypothetical protein G9A89_008030 [Geosiphon pyriformis]|nr:hypothetical protein G9A89_008030 [Geosiphon pyriformis]